MHRQRHNRTLRSGTFLLCCLGVLLFGAHSLAAQVPGCEDCPPTGVIVDAFSGSQSQAGHLSRDNVASTCAGKTFPGTVDAANTYNYETSSYRNYGAAACVTVNFDPLPATGFQCGTNAQASAYLGGYDPLNQAVGFLGDSGVSAAASFSFLVPADSAFEIVVTNSAFAAICSYSLEVSNVACQLDTAVCEITDVPTSGPIGNVTLIIMLAIGAGFVLRRL